MPVGIYMERSSEYTSVSVGIYTDRQITHADYRQKGSFTASCGKAGMIYEYG